MIKKKIGIRSQLKGNVRIKKHAQRYKKQIRQKANYYEVKHKIVEKQIVIGGVA